MKTVALVLVAAAAAVSAQQPILGLTGSQPSPQTYQQRLPAEAQPFGSPQAYQRRPAEAQPFGSPQAYQRRPAEAQPFGSSPAVARPVAAQPAYYRRPLPAYNRQAANLPYVPIVSRTDYRGENGYSYSFESGDGTVVQQRGLVKPEPDGGYIVTEGFFSYITPDGNTHSIRYTADENGFQPVGTQIQQNPESIQKK